MLERTFDEESGIIRVKGTGLWTLIDVEEHFSALQSMIASVREKNLPVRVLVDLREAPRQNPGIEQQFSEQKTKTYRTGDRVAILTADENEKEHVRTYLDGAEIWSWQSELVAEQWLLLDGANALSSDEISMRRSSNPQT